MHHSRLAEAINPYNDTTTQVMQNMSNLGLDSRQQSGVIENLLEQQTHIMGANDIFWLCGAIFLLLIVLVWRAKPPFMNQGGGGGGGAH